MLNEAEKLIESFFDRNKACFPAGHYKSAFANRGTPPRPHLGSLNNQRRKAKLKARADMMVNLLAEAEARKARQMIKIMDY